MDRALIEKNLNNTISETNFPSLGKKYTGKVRDVYTKDNQIILIATDKISAFDVILGTIPFKGQVLNQMALFWFEKTKDIMENHVLDTPDPQVVVGKNCKIIPIEIIVRGYITGSLWREYENGTRKIYGMTFPDGLKKNQKFDVPILTPTTKAEYGDHDTPISKEEIFAKGLVSRKQWKEIEEKAMKLFQRGTEIAEKQNLILVDTKYEIGIYEGRLVLVDEIHTPDSSRFWYTNSYEERFAAGENPEQLSKEFVRQWLLEKGFSGSGKPPQLTDDVKVETAMKYINLYKQITGKEFAVEDGDVLERIRKNLKRYLK